MILDAFRQDIRVGLRILFKEKSFCLLAVLVLALGIAGVTSQFTIVNAFVLRGFSFPHPEQLASAGRRCNLNRKNFIALTARFTGACKGPRQGRESASMRRFLCPHFWLWKPLLVGR